MIIEKIILFFKRLFKKDDLKLLEAPKEKIEEINEEDKKKDFVDSLKVFADNKNETIDDDLLVCVGDGLGIKKKISC